jgi:septal ring factor EnvC (AmiA/AmiB activator)
MSGSLWAATPGQLVKSRGDIMQLGARLSALEKNLGSNNDKYIAAVEKIRLLETDVTTYQQRLSGVRAELIRREQELARILRSQALAAVEDEIVENDAYQALTAQNRARSQAALRETEALEKIVAEFNERLEVLRRDEQELLKLSYDLESKKKQMTEVYLARLDERQRLETEVEKQKISTRIKKIRKAEQLGQDIAPELKFALPLDAITEATPSEKGVTYKFSKLQPIKAPRSGRVIYNGELASYGKVLMLDHGSDIRTVMLGRFSSALEKNAQVNAGDILGHTETDADSLYFEVRKKNVAQKTIHWMDQGATSKI